jgi:hypothetical protein
MDLEGVFGAAACAIEAAGAVAVDEREVSKRKRPGRSRLDPYPTVTVGLRKLAARAEPGDIVSRPKKE